MAKPLFFADQSKFRAWLTKNHDKLDEAQIGFYKKASGIPSMTWPEAVDEALCFGWIDGRRNGIDDVSYMNRFTPRKRTSNWSAINIKRANELAKEGLMQPAGLEAFSRRTDDRSAIYSYEQMKTAKLPEKYAKRFRESRKAWGYYKAQSPSYKRTVAWWVISAKKEETRLRRLGQLIEHSGKGRKHPNF
ncbi:MAG TPA: YdeI/OmpD-associated family protein [Actinomycetota bacterium]|nr:YdeI/OmpD-associated family protein [Actinomycetota bacterium]